jgi:hypothetical protein
VLTLLLIQMHPNSREHYNVEALATLGGALLTSESLTVAQHLSRTIHRKLIGLFGYVLAQNRRRRGIFHLLIPAPLRVIS